MWALVGVVGRAARTTSAVTSATWKTAPQPRTPLSTGHAPLGQRPVLTVNHILDARTPEPGEHGAWSMEHGTWP